MSGYGLLFRSYFHTSGIITDSETHPRLTGIKLVMLLLGDGSKMNKSTIAPLFFGAIFSIAGAIIAGGLVEEWWAFAILVPVGSIAGWKIGEWI